MCGIAGIVDLKADRDIDQAALRRMTDALRHRGPDGEGYHIAPGIGLGHRRLAIIDIEGGVQPYHAQTRECVLSFNGEIYNYRALGQSLVANGVTLKTNSDTEVLAEGCALKGSEFVHQLRGMFAVSFWDPAARRLTLMRDRLGEKPLYYTQTANGFLAFASELGAIVASGLAETEINAEAVADYFYYGYVPDPKTIYRNIHKLPPAHILTCGSGQPARLERYWRPVFANTHDISFDAASDALQSRLDDAVATQMISDVPLGAFLSGGVDSAAIVSSMKETGSDLIACTVGFDDAAHDERAGAREIAAKYNARHYEHVAKIDANDLIDTVAATYSEPFADSSALPSYIVSQLARQHVTVALSGDGGDELFAGYRRYPFFLSEEKMRSFAPAFLRRLMFGTLGALYPKLDWAPQPLRAKTTLQALGQSSADAYAAAVAISLPLRASAILSGDLRTSLGDYRPQSVVSSAMNDANGVDPLSRAQHVDLMTWLPGRMLTKIDRASMAHSLEVRPPFLDHKLVEWAGALPPSFKMHKGERKRILKNALEPRIGREYLNRPKQGFDLPVAEWLRAKAKNPMRRLDDSTAWRQSGLINERAVEKMMHAHQRGASDCGQELWSVIMFDAFLRAAKRA